MDFSVACDSCNNETHVLNSFSDPFGMYCQRCWFSSDFTSRKKLFLRKKGITENIKFDWSGLGVN